VDGSWPFFGEVNIPGGIFGADHHPAITSKRQDFDAGGVCSDTTQHIQHIGRTNAQRVRSSWPFRRRNPTTDTRVLTNEILSDAASAEGARPASFER
jgi:hypothetical protein